MNTETPLLSPKERGERLKQLRKLARFKQNEIATIIGVSKQTYQAWELGMYGGISEEQAEKLVSIYQAEGIESSTSWIIYGTGNPPIKKTGIQSTNLLVHKDEVLSQKINQPFKKNQIVLLSELDEFDDQIKLELQYFRSNNNNSTHLIVKDENMLPFFSPGDIVGGIKLSNHQKRKAFSSICIVETKENNIFLRQIQPGRRYPFFTLLCSNPKTPSEELIMHDVEVNAIYLAVWHRKKNPNF